MKKLGRRESLPSWMRVFLFFLIVILALSLIFSVLIDFVYTKRIKNDSLIRGIHFLVHTLNFFDIRYDKVCNVLSSGLGIILTILSMFTTMNKGITDVSDKKVYGIPRNELPVPENGGIFKLMRRANYFTPILMLACLSLDFFVCGYFIIVYSYVCMIINHYLYNSTFSKDINQEVLINKLLDSLYEYRQNPQKGLENYSVLVENISCYVTKEDMWKNAEQLFEKLIGRQEYSLQELLLFSRHFYEKIFAGNVEVATRIMQKYLNMYVEQYGHESQINNQIIASWGMVQVLFSRFSEEEMLDFLKWFLDYDKRVKAIYSVTETVIDTTCLKYQTGFMLILLEKWLGQNMVKYKVMMEVVIDAWSKGKSIFAEENELLGCFVDFLGTEEQREIEVLKRAVENLRGDYIQIRQKSMVLKLVRMGGNQDVQ